MALKCIQTINFNDDEKLQCHMSMGRDRDDNQNQTDVLLDFGSIGVTNSTGSALFWKVGWGDLICDVF